MKSRGWKSATINSAWKVGTALYVVLIATMLLGLWPGNASVFFAIFLFINGALIFASGNDMKRADWVAYGLYTIALGIAYPTWFSTAPFLAAGLILGVPLLVGTLMK